MESDIDFWPTYASLDWFPPSIVEKGLCQNVSNAIESSRTLVSDTFDFSFDYRNEVSLNHDKIAIFVVQKTTTAINLICTSLFLT